jgi:hypothetical protein
LNLSKSFWIPPATTAVAAVYRRPWKRSLVGDWFDAGGLDEEGTDEEGTDEGGFDEAALEESASMARVFFSVETIPKIPVMISPSYTSTAQPDLSEGQSIHWLACSSLTFDAERVTTHAESALSCCAYVLLGYSGSTGSDPGSTGAESKERGHGNVWVQMKKGHGEDVDGRWSYGSESAFPSPGGQLKISSLPPPSEPCKHGTVRRSFISSVRYEEGRRRWTTEGKVLRTRSERDHERRGGGVGEGRGRAI